MLQNEKINELQQKHRAGLFHHNESKKKIHTKKENKVQFTIVIISFRKA